MNNEAVATVDGKASALGKIEVTPDQVELVKRTVAIGATDDELKLYFFECHRRGVHPMDRLIHFVKRKSNNGPDRAAFQCAIDFMRMQAEDTKLYRGQDEPEYGPEDKSGYPEWARVVVHKKDPDTGDVYPNPATAYWAEFYPGDGNAGFMWRKMPRLMLAKVAEAQALRKAFPRQFNNLYIFDEMQQADIVTSGTPKANPPVKQPAEKKAPVASDARSKFPVLLEEYCSGDIDMMEDVCLQISTFKNKEGEERSFTVADVMAQREDGSYVVSDQWINAAYGKLKKTAEGKE